MGRVYAHNFNRVQRTVEPTSGSLPSFDELVKMAQEDPEGFEDFRKQCCEEFICGCSESMQGRLRAQQSHIDRVIDNCSNPNHVNIVLSQELSKQVAKFKQALTGELATQRADSGNVVSFTNRNSKDVH